MFSCLSLVAFVVFTRSSFLLALIVFVFCFCLLAVIVFLLGSGDCYTIPSFLELRLVVSFTNPSNRLKFEGRGHNDGASSNPYHFFEHRACHNKDKLVSVSNLKESVWLP